MKYNNEWKDYKLLSTGNGYKIEYFNGVILNRPDPQVIWQFKNNNIENKAIAKYIRSNTGGGFW